MGFLKGGCSRPNTALGLVSVLVEIPSDTDTGEGITIMRKRVIIGDREVIKRTTLSIGTPLFPPQSYVPTGISRLWLNEDEGSTTKFIELKPLDSQILFKSISTYMVQITALLDIVEVGEMKIPTRVGEPESEVKRCSSCGLPMEIEDKFCTACGAKRGSE